jgi:transcription elongation factor
MEQQLRLSGDGPVISASVVPACPDRVFVESRNPDELWRSCLLISSVVKTKYMTLIPIDERIDIFNFRSQDRRIMARSWVRLRRGPNKGDLAYVLHSSVNSDRVQIAVLPRGLFSLPGGFDNKKRKRKSQRVPARPFDPIEIKRIHGPDAIQQKGGNYYVFDKKVYRKGMLILNVQSVHTLLRVSSPPLAEIKPFIDAGFVTPGAALAVTSDEVGASVQPGDSVELIAGEQSGCKAMVVTCHDHVALVDVEPSVFDQPSMFLEVPLKHIRRIFHVREGTGEHAGSSGCVVAVLDGGRRLSFIEDKTRNIVSHHFISN